MKPSNPYLLYAVTDPIYTLEKPLTVLVEQAILGGITCVQLRDKTASKEDFLAQAVALKAVTDRYDIPLIINDYVDIAKQIDAAGVHIGQSDLSLKQARQILGKDKIIGVSARTVEQAQKAQAEGASYLGVGAIFGTMTKADAKPLSIQALQTICHAVDIPVVAIGGVNGENVTQLRKTAIAGAAMVSAIFSSEDIKQTSKRLRTIMEQVVG